MTTVPANVTIKIYNLAGQLVAEMTAWTEALVDNKEAGTFRFNPERWASGVYFARVEALGSSVDLRFAVER